MELEAIAKKNDDNSLIYCSGCSRPSRGASYNEYDIRLRCLQGWFFRASWATKYRFLKEISELTVGTSVLEPLLKCLDAIYTKDMVDSFARDRIIFSYDVIPLDDNRSMVEHELWDKRRLDILWFLSLDTDGQVEVIMKLMKLGGGGLMFFVYKQMAKLFKERREMNMVLNAVDASIRDLMKETYPEQDESISTLSFSISEVDSIKNNIYTAQKEHELARRNSALTKFSKKYGLINHGKKKESSEVVDYIQVLPLWLNRKIMLYLDEESLEGLKSTGKYWSKMIDEAVREKRERAAINEKISKIRTCGSEAPADDAEETSDDLLGRIPVLGKKAFLAELGLKHSDLAHIQKKMESHGELKMKVNVLEEFCFEKIVCSVNENCKILAASTPNRSVNFYFIRTGMKTKDAVNKLPSDVTSMAIHDDGFHVIIGCDDGSLLCVNFRKNKRTISYSGHAGPVIKIHAFDDKLVSAAEDRTIKHFDMWSGLCLAHINMEDSISSMIVLKRNPRSSVIAGTAEGKLVFIDLGKKKIYREVAVHERKVKGIAEVGSVLVTHSTDRTIRLWSVKHVEWETSRQIIPFVNVRLKTVATAVECLGNEIFAACADGKVRLICKLTGVTSRVLQVTQKKAIAGIYVMQEKDTTKMIMWHEGGIEMRSFFAGNAGRKKKVKRQWGYHGAGDYAPRTISQILNLSLLARRSRRRTTSQGTGGSWLPQLMDKDTICTEGDVFTKMMKKFQHHGDPFLTTFSRIRKKGSIQSDAESTSDLF